MATALFVGGGNVIQEATACENASKKRRHKSRLIFLGTGSSTGCPRPICPLLFSPSAPSTAALKQMRQDMTNYCRTSNLALQNTPKTNKNYRNNPSLLLSLVTDDNRQTNIIIDVGKTFREGALRWMPDYGIASLDAIVLTHQHMDAAAGLDDVRGFQQWMIKSGQRAKAIPMPLFLAQECLEDLQERYPWLLPTEKAQDKNDSNKPAVERHVASFDVTVLEYFQPCNVKGLVITPLPVMHGEDLVSLGFAFGIGQTHVVYLSDISRMLPETLDYIRNRLPPTDILVVDALHLSRTNAVHFNLHEAVALVRQLEPKQVYLVGMNCDSFLPHDEMNAKLRCEYGNIQLAHDGLVIDV